MAQAKPTTGDGFDYIARGSCLKLGKPDSPRQSGFAIASVIIESPGSDMGQEFVKTANRARRCSRSASTLLTTRDGHQSYALFARWRGSGRAQLSFTIA